MSNAPLALLLRLVALSACMLSALCSAMAVDVWMYADYPDGQLVPVQEGSAIYSLTVGGTHKEKAGNSVTTTEVSVKASQHLSSVGGVCTAKTTLSGKVVERTVNRESKTSSTAIHTLQASDSQTDTADAGIFGNAVLVSKKQGLASFSLPRGMGAAWELVDYQVHTEVVETSPEDTARDSYDSTGFMSGRLPYYGGGGSTEFSIGARRAEAAGKNNGSVLLDGGAVESPWMNGRAHGAFTVPVKVSVSPGGVTFDTVPVWQAKQQEYGIDEDDFVFDGVLTVQWSLGERPTTRKLELAPADKKAYDSWIPTPEADAPGKEDYGAPALLQISATLKTTKPGEPTPTGRIEFTLEEVSEHAGRCLNYPPEMTTKPDLRFADTQDAGIIVDPNNPRRAYTKDRVSEATVTIETLDTAAYGKLTARCVELGLEAEDAATQYRYLTIPRDDNENLVSDAWERQVGVFNEQYPKDWDGESVDGQIELGDGLSLYREYRGVMVPERGMVRLQRLQPKNKELFVIDAEGVFDAGLWEEASHMVAIHLREDLVKGGGQGDDSRIVDYHMPGGVDAQHKFAVRIEVVRGLDDRPLPDGKVNPDNKVYGYCYGDNSTPRNAAAIRLFPDRIRKYLIDNAAEMLQRAVRDANSSEAHDLESAGIPNWLARRALERLDDGARERLVHQMLTLSAIHETGHACGLPGHRVDAEDGSRVESSEGSKLCPMRYPDHWDNYNLTILQVLFKSDADLPLQFIAFCEEKPYDCFSLLNVRD